MKYTIHIDKVTEEVTHPLRVKCEMDANSDSAAEQVMNDLVISVAKHNNLSTNDLNTNLYKTEWINGI